MCAPYLKAKLQVALSTLTSLVLFLVLFPCREGRSYQIFFQNVIMGSKKWNLLMYSKYEHVQKTKQKLYFMFVFRILYTCWNLFFRNLVAFHLFTKSHVEESVISSSCALLVHGSWQFLFTSTPCTAAETRVNTTGQIHVDSESLFGAKVKYLTQKNILASF